MGFEMKTHDLSQALTQLATEAHRLAEDELDDRGDSTERYRQARSLNERLLALRSQVDSAPPDGRALLDDTWRAAERDLIFLLNAAESTSPPDMSQDVTALARQISAEAFDLAVALATGKADKATLQPKVLALDERLKKLAHMPGHDAPAVQQALSDADLDMNYVFAGGKGSTSVRLAQYLQSQKR